MKAVLRKAAMRAAIATLGLALSMGIVAQAVAGPHMLVDIRTGKVIEHEDAFQKWYPASLTKLMTAYVAFRQVKAGRMTLTTPIVMSKRAAAEPPSKIGLKPGQALTLDDALKVLLVFTLLDRERMPLASLPGHVERVDVFREFNALYFRLPPAALAEALVADLLRAGAVRRDGGYLMPAAAGTPRPESSA